MRFQNMEDAGENQNNKKRLNKANKKETNMCCEHCENDFNLEEDIIVDAGGAVRSVLMDIGDVLIDMCKELDIGEIKINVSQDYETGDLNFKAKVDGQKVLEMKANDFVPYFGD